MVRRREAVSWNSCIKNGRNSSGLEYALPTGLCVLSDGGSPGLGQGAASSCFKSLQSYDSIAFWAFV